MTDLQRLVVDDHIRRLSDEGAVRRAERELARPRHPAAEPHAPDYDVEGHAFTASASPSAPTRQTAAAHPAGGSARVRVGQWLMHIGTAIAGTDRAVGDAVRRASAEASTSPCEDSKPLSHAA